MNKLRSLFASDETYNKFRKKYFSTYDTTLKDIELFGWNSVADDILDSIEDHWYEVGSVIEIEIPWVNTRSERVELIEVGELISVPIYDGDDVIGSYLMK